MKWWSWSIPLGIAVVLHLPTLDAELVWDDQIVQERQLVAFQSLRDVFFPPDGIQEWSRSYYRPLVVASYLLDRGLYGSERFHGHHLTNVLIHAAVCVCVTLLARRVLVRQRFGEWGAVAAGVIFATHPIHIESISPLMGRSDMLAAVFTLASLLLVLRYRDHPRAIGSLAAAALLYFAALLSKEVAIAALLLAPLLWLLVPRPADATAAATPRKRTPGSTRRRARTRGTPIKSDRIPPHSSARIFQLPHGMHWVPLGCLFLVATVFYFVLRDRAGSTAGGSLGQGWSAVVEHGVRALAYYLVKVVVPPPQSGFVTLTEMPELWLGIVSVSLTAGAAILSLRSMRSDNTLLIAGIWFTVALAPSMAVAVRKISEQPVAERYLYLPSVSLSLLVGGLLCSGLARRRLRACTVAAVASVSILYGLQSLARQRVWHDDLAFWSDTVAKAPSQGLPTYQLGLAYNELGRIDKSYECFARSLDLYDDAEGRGLAHNSIGTIHMIRGDYKAAEASFTASIRARPRYRTPHFNLGALDGALAEREWDRTGIPDIERLERARRHLSEAVRLSPSYVKAQFTLAQQTAVLADAQRGAGHIERSRELLSNARERAAWLAAYDARGDFGRRAVELVQAIDNAPYRGTEQP